MATATYPETKTLERVCALAAARPGVGAARVAKGYRRWSEDEHFQEQVRALGAETQGYFSAALRRAAHDVGRGAHGVEIVAELAVYVPVQVSTDLNAAWEFALALRDVLEDPAAYADGEFAPRVSVQFRGVEAVADGGIAFFDFGAYGGGSVLVPAP